MATEAIYTKSLGGAEDLLLDASNSATVIQTRAGKELEITKINSSTIPYSGKFGDPAMVSIKDQLDTKANTVSSAYVIDTVDDFGTVPSGIDTVIVKDNNRGGTFIYDATQSAVNNGGTIFDGWCRQYSGAVNVKWFGASNSRSDNDVPIQAALDVSDNIYIENGLYVISATIKLDDSKTITGANRYRTILQTSGNFPILEYTGLGFARLRIENLRLYYSSYDETKTSRIALKLSSGTQASPASNWIEQSLFSDIEINGAYYGIYNTSGAWDIRFSGIFITNTRIGFYWAFGTTLNLTNVLVNGGIQAFYMYNVYNVVMDSCSADVVKAKNGGVLNFVSISSLNITGFSSEGCQLIGNSARYFYINNCQGVHLKGAYFLGLVFDGEGGSAHQAFLHVINNSDSVKIENYNVPMFDNSIYHKNSPAQIAFVTRDNDCKNEVSVIKCRFTNLVAHDDDPTSTTSVYFIQNADVIDDLCTYTGYNFSNNRLNLYSDSKPTSGRYAIGQKVWANNPTVAGTIGWVSTTNESNSVFKAISPEVKTGQANAVNNGTLHTIAHGLVGTVVGASLTPLNSRASSIPYYVTYDSTNININYTSDPNGTTVWAWIAYSDIK